MYILYLPELIYKFTMAELWQTSGSVSARLTPCFAGTERKGDFPAAPPGLRMAQI